jgi:hypothetical protein
VLIAVYASSIGTHFVLQSGDDFAYASTTVDLSQGSPLVHHLASPAYCSWLVPTNDVPGACASKYPVGLSLLLVPFFLVAGYRGLFFLDPLMGALGVLAIHRLSWHLTRRRSVAALAAALLATLPSVIGSASGIDSDISSLTLG